MKDQADTSNRNDGAAAGRTSSKANSKRHYVKEDASFDNTAVLNQSFHDSVAEMPKPEAKIGEDML